MHGRQAVGTPAQHVRSAQPPPLPVTPIPAHRVSDAPTVWWVGCHGGAGVTTLARLTGLGVDCGTAWPDTRGVPGVVTTPVVLVCRATATGAWAAMGAVEQWRRRLAMTAVVGGSPWLMPSDIQLVGLVAVAASPRRPPRLAGERLGLLAGWIPQMWRVGWVDALLATDDPRDVGMPPDVDALRHQLAAVLA